MRGYCGIELDKDKTFLCFALKEKGKLKFLEEVSLNIPFEGDNLIDFFKENTQRLIQKIEERESAYSLEVERIYLSLPWNLGKRRFVEEMVFLGEPRRLSGKDILFAKRYVEEKNLDWDERCIHQLVLSFQAEGNDYPLAPLGISTQKIILRSFLVYTKNGLYTSLKENFSSFGRYFAGFIYPILGSLSLFLDEETKDLLVIKIGYQNSQLVVFVEKRLKVLEEYDFGLSGIFEALERKFLISSDLLKEVFSRYFSFKELFDSKEIKIKHHGQQLVLDVVAFNNCVKEYLKNKILGVLEGLKSRLNLTALRVAFIGRLNIYEGFKEFLETFISHPLKVDGRRESSSFACLSYAVDPFLERGYLKKEGFLERIFNLYKEYF